MFWASFIDPFHLRCTPMAYLYFAHWKTSRPCVSFSAQDSWTTYRSRLLSIKLEVEGAALEACYQHDNGFNFRASACSLEFMWDLTGQSVTAVNLSVKANKNLLTFWSEGQVYSMQRAFCARAEGEAWIKSVVCAKCKSASCNINGTVARWECLASEFCLRELQLSAASQRDSDRTMYAENPHRHSWFSKHCTSCSVNQTVNISRDLDTSRHSCGMCRAVEGALVTLIASGASNLSLLNDRRSKWSIGQSEGLLIPRSSVWFHLNTENSNSHELHRPSIKGTKLLLKVIKAILIIT